MSKSDITSLRRRHLLVQLRQLFARIDEAFVRGDYDEAHATNKEVSELLSALRVEPAGGRDDPQRASGVQSRTGDDVDPQASRRVS